MKCFLLRAMIRERPWRPVHTTWGNIGKLHYRLRRFVKGDDMRHLYLQFHFGEVGGSKLFVDSREAEIRDAFSDIGIERTNPKEALYAVYDGRYKVANFSSFFVGSSFAGMSYTTRRLYQSYVDDNERNKRCLLDRLGFIPTKVITPVTGRTTLGQMKQLLDGFYDYYRTQGR